MAEYSESGLTVRWATPDLASSEQQSPGFGIVVAARPANPSNVVTALYTVDGGPARIVRGHRLRTAPRGDGDELFGLQLPPQNNDARVAFIPILSCSGRQADPRRGGFALTPLAQPTLQQPTFGSLDGAISRNERVAPSHLARFGFELEFLFRVTAPVDCDRDPVGETPDGLRMKFLLRSGGYVQGPAITGEILPVGGDWMRIRPDGVGIAEISALIKPAGGGVILTEYSGIVDFGPDGYRQLAAGGGPKRASLRFAPRYLTADPSWAWMNRLQCFSVGEVNLERYLVEYDLYTFRSNPSDDRDIGKREITCSTQKQRL
ncbi:MAG: DUF3237 domain-containing protein [Hyphomicrobiales bacterium]|jgi:Protein of unknown function (DUF3237)|nr:DUF3237 domain-containing protein [Hyphomicrobiales bacterium]